MCAVGDAAARRAPRAACGAEDMAEVGQAERARDARGYVRCPCASACVWMRGQRQGRERDHERDTSAATSEPTSRVPGTAVSDAISIERALTHCPKKHFSFGTKSGIECRRKHDGRPRGTVHSYTAQVLPAQRVAATYWLLTSGRPSIACTCGMTHATKLDRSAGGRAGSGDAGDFTPTTLTHQPARTWRTSLCLSALAVSSSPRPTYPSALPNRAFGVVGGGGGGAASAHRVSRDDVPSVATASSSTSDDDTRHHHHHRPVLTRPRRPVQSLHRGTR